MPVVCPVVVVFLVAVFANLGAGVAIARRELIEGGRSQIAGRRWMLLLWMMTRGEQRECRRQKAEGRKLAERPLLSAFCFLHSFSPELGTYRDTRRMLSRRVRTARRTLSN